MNTIRDIRFKYNISNTDLANILNINKSTISTILDRDIDMLSIKQLCSLQEYTKVDYNTLLGETIFTPNNIEKRPDINILENTGKNNRTFEDIKNSIKNELKEELLKELLKKE